MAIIAISRGTFSGGKYLAKSVADRLGYRCLSREELLLNTARRYDIPEYALTAALDNEAGFPEGMNLRRIQYICYVRATLAREVKYDNVVYHGQVGHLLLKGVPHLLKVRVIADMEFRIAAAMEQYQVGRETAMVLIRKIDRDRAMWTKVMYGVDWENPSQYDLVVNIETMSTAEACDRMISIIRSELKATPESRKMLRDFVLGTDVRARIAAHESIHDSDIEIEADDGIITIKGKADSVGEAERIERVARQAPGVKEVKSALRILESGIYVSR